MIQRPDHNFLFIKLTDLCETLEKRKKDSICIIEFLEFFSENESPPPQSPNSITPLHVAIKNEDYGILKQFVATYKNLCDAFDENLHTPLTFSL